MSRKVSRKWGKPGLLTLVACLFAGLVSASGVVAADEESVIEETVVTGSRIKRSGLETASPISVFTSVDIETSFRMSQLSTGRMSVRASITVILVSQQPDSAAWDLVEPLC